jgi:hypothetical protein
MTDSLLAVPGITDEPYNEETKPHAFGARRH